jgi:lipopolysaccharide biosynthesis regulator YciM
MKGNEHADSLADMAIEQVVTVMDRADIPRDNYRISEAAKESESRTMIRLNELHVKSGSARQQHYSVKQTHIVNQHNTCTVSHYTLTNILKEKSKHLWMCPACSEEDLMTKLN